MTRDGIFKDKRSGLFHVDVSLGTNPTTDNLQRDTVDGVRRDEVNDRCLADQAWEVGSSREGPGWSLVTWVSILSRSVTGALLSR